MEYGIHFFIISHICWEIRNKDRLKFQPNSIMIQSRFIYNPWLPTKVMQSWNIGTKTKFSFFSYSKTFINDVTQGGGQGKVDFGSGYKRVTERGMGRVWYPLHLCDFIYEWSLVCMSPVSLVFHTIAAVR